MATEKLCTGLIEDIGSLIANCGFTSDALFLGERLPDNVVTSAKERQTLLLFKRFNERIPFAEVRIPRLLLYPIQKEDNRMPHNKRQRVKLGVYEYLNEISGKVEFFRFQGLETTEFEA